MKTTWGDNMRKIFSFLIIVSIFILAFNAITALAEGGTQSEIVVKVFWGKGCSQCEKMKEFLNEMKTKYIGLQVEEREIFYNKENEKIFDDLLKKYNKDFTGVPTVFIEDNVIHSFGDDSKKNIETILAQRLELSQKKPTAAIKENTDTKKPLEQKENRLTKIDDDSSLRVSSERPATIESKGTNETNYISDDVDVNNTENKKSQANSLQKKQEKSDIQKDMQNNGIPMFGSINPSKIPLPMATVLIALVDSFNPCAFFILVSMLGLLVHAQSRAKVLLAGGIFVLFSGVIYFIFMAAWLNLFLIVGNIKNITVLAGAVSIIIAGINIKDFFIFKKGVSLSISEENTKNLFGKMRKITRISSWTGIVLSASVLAIAANAYEVLCTAGFPMVFTRILTLNNLSTVQYYSYLALYNIVYILPLTIIVLIFSISLGMFKMKEIQGRMLKLISGIMMFGLGAILLFGSQLMENIMILVILVISSIMIGLLMGYWDTVRLKQKN